jgi:hypothetical protein
MNKIVRGPRSAYNTVQLLHGKKLSHEVLVSMGITEADLDPLGNGRMVQISFKENPNIHEHKPPISETKGGISQGIKFPLDKSKGG